MWLVLFGVYGIKKTNLSLSRSLLSLSSLLRTPACEEQGGVGDANAFILLPKDWKITSYENGKTVER